MLQALCLLAAMWCMAPAPASATLPDTAGVRTRTLLFGAGSQNVLETYLSPLEYTGVSTSQMQMTERRMPRRLANWLTNWYLLITMGFDGSILHSPTKNVDAFDGNVTSSVALVRGWRPAPQWRFAIGPMGEACGGATFNTRNGNNPVQARLSASLGLTALGEFDFVWLRRKWTARLQADAPVIGLMFSPNFGQSYYELLGLGHTDRNLRLTTPFNAPSLRLMATIQVPLTRKLNIVAGYRADIRQSHVNHLKSHHWMHQFVVGISRTIKTLSR